MRTLLFILLAAAGVARADVVECQNGDRYNGRVLLVDEHNVKVQNEIAGILSIPRAKVATIALGDFKPARTSPVAQPPQATNILSPAQPLRIDSASIQQVQNQLLGDASPEATQMFQDMVRGLMSGKMDMADIRTKAQTTLDELKDLQKELGDDDATALLSSYAGILEGFIKQAPPSTKTNAPALKKETAEE